MMEKISANGIDHVRNVKTIMVFECKGIDDEHGLMGSKKAFVRSAHMWYVSMAVKSKYLACYFLLVFVELLLPKKDHQESRPNLSPFFHPQSPLSSPPYSLSPFK